MYDKDDFPEISIIVPVYNVDKYLEKCISSLLEQTLTDLEIILVNDGSTDTSAEICDRFKLQDNRIKVIHKDNGGISSARNVGLQNATGKFIGFVDSDDYIELNTYEKLLHAITYNDADISICGRIIENNNSKLVEIVDPTKDMVFSGVDILKKILLKQNVSVAPWGKLFKRELFDDKEFPMNRIYEDVYIIPEIISTAKKIVCIKEALYHYMIRQDSITQSSYNKKSLDLITNSEQLYKYIIDSQFHLRNEVNYYYFENILSCYSKYISSEIHIKKVYKNDKILLKKKINEHLNEMLFNPYPTIIRKLQYLLIFVGFSKFKKIFKRRQLT